MLKIMIILIINIILLLFIYCMLKRTNFDSFWNKFHGLSTHVSPPCLCYFVFEGINIVVSKIGLAISKLLYPFYIQYKCIFFS